MNGPILNLQQMINFDNSESDYSESNKISEMNESKLTEDNINFDSKKNKNSEKKKDNSKIINNTYNYNINQTGTNNQLSTRRILTNQFDAYNPHNTSKTIDIKLKVGNFLTDHNNTPRMIKYIFANILRKSSVIQNYKLILNELIKTNKKFYDNQFPPNQNSLIKGFNYFQVNKFNIEKISERTPLQKKFKKIKWIREMRKLLIKI